MQTIADCLIEEHKRLSEVYLQVTVEATKKRDYRCGLAEDVRKRLRDLEDRMVLLKGTE